VPALKSTIHATSSLVSISSPKTIPLQAFKLIPYYLYLTPSSTCVRSSIGNSQRLQFTLQHSTLADYITTYQWERGTQHNSPMIPSWCPHVQTKHPSNIYPTVLTLPSPKYTLFLLAFRRSDNPPFNILISPLLCTLQLNHQHIVISARAARVLLYFIHKWLHIFYGMPIKSPMAHPTTQTLNPSFRLHFPSHTQCYFSSEWVKFVKSGAKTIRPLKFRKPDKTRKPLQCRSAGNSHVTAKCCLVWFGVVLCWVGSVGCVVKLNCFVVGCFCWWVSFVKFVIKTTGFTWNFTFDWYFE
jgi:hypothetical protein